MKKNSKYLIISLIIFIVIIIALFIYSFLIREKFSSNKEDSTIKDNSIINVSTAAGLKDPSIMTDYERIKLRVSPNLKVEVLERGADGSPTGYKIIK